MDFVFMLTRSDQTVTDCLDVLDDIRPLGLAHIGFKDVGVSPDVLAKLARRIKAAGAISYMEVVSTSREACLRSAQVARDIGVDRLLGGTQVEEVLNILAGSTVRYLPFPGGRSNIRQSSRARPPRSRTIAAGFRPWAAPVSTCSLTGRPRPIRSNWCARRGAAATASCWSPAASIIQRRSAILPPQGRTPSPSGPRLFDGSFAPRLGCLRSQLRAVLDACG